MGNVGSHISVFPKTQNNFFEPLSGWNWKFNFYFYYDRDVYVFLHMVLIYTGVKLFKKVVKWRTDEGLCASTVGTVCVFMCGGCRQ